MVFNLSYDVQSRENCDKARLPTARMVPITLFSVTKKDADGAGDAGGVLCAVVHVRGGVAAGSTHDEGGVRGAYDVGAVPWAAGKVLMLVALFMQLVLHRVWS